MDFGARPAFDAKALDVKGTPVPDTTLRLAWFERSNTEQGSAAEGGLAEGGGVLDRFREADGLVYNGEEDYEL
jgi:hypothetical protein